MTTPSEKEEKFGPEAILIAFDNGKKTGREELAAELRALLEVSKAE